MFCLWIRPAEQLGKVNYRQVKNDEIAASASKTRLENSFFQLNVKSF